MITVIIICTIGLIISIYGICVERTIKQNNMYKPACDISDKISCSKPFLSSYSAMLGISNIWASALYYLAILTLTILDLTTIAFLLSCLGLIASSVFAYILFFKIKSLCLICISLYAINSALAIACYCMQHSS
jgi:uncharacterized membrane protein